MLRINDAVVHLDHGVGRYRGLQTITTDGQTTEFLTLEYANEAKLYVPVASLNLISRYSGAEQDAAPINHLGSDNWTKTKRKAAEKIRDVAAELLDIYAQRAARKGFRYAIEIGEYEKFSAAFPFEETADQESAISSVIDDMNSEAGYGQTSLWRCWVRKNRSCYARSFLWQYRTTSR